MHFLPSLNTATIAQVASFLTVAIVATSGAFEFLHDLGEFLSEGRF